MAKLTVLLVHGAWHRPAHYQPFLDILARKGYPCIAPTLPSTTNTPPPEEPVEADVRCIREAAQRVADQGRELVAVGHSYGGIVATEALAGLGVKTRAAQGKRGGVRWLVYVTALLLSGTDCMGDVLTPEDVPLDALQNVLQWLRVEGTQVAFAQDNDCGSVFYSDLPKEEHAQWTKLLTSCPIEAAAYVPKEKAYRDIDTVYVYCERDAAIPLSVQRIMVDKVKELGIRVLEESLLAGHFPSLSMPGELAGIVERLSDGRARL